MDKATRGGSLYPGVSFVRYSSLDGTGGDMMGISKYGAKQGNQFPPLLKASDISKPVTYTISSAEERTMKGEQKVIVGFEEIEKQWVVNKTNIGALTDLFGDIELSGLVGRQVTLASTPTQYNGQTVKGIRVVG